MALLITSLIIFTKCILYLKVTLCTEVDFCIPVRVDRPKHERNVQQRAEQMHERDVAFRLSAFKEELYLRLTQDSSFIAAGNLLPGTDSASPPPDSSADLRECFYSGDVNEDPQSFAAVSLCRGIQGGFSFGGMEYFIAASVDTYAHGNSWNRTHVIRRRRRSGGNSTSRCGVTPDANYNVSLEKYKHLRDLESGGFMETVLKSLGRSKRFASIPRFVEVLVVADESMAKFHGDDLKHYLLTLMSVAARLYKHPSILNSINIVVVGFVVLNEADKGPKVSSNAALTLRNFCSWQKKMNKHSDKHPDYWDTAILFTKQVSKGEESEEGAVHQCRMATTKVSMETLHPRTSMRDTMPRGRQRQSKEMANFPPAWREIRKARVSVSVYHNASIWVHLRVLCGHF